MSVLSGLSRVIGRSRFGRLGMIALAGVVVAGCGTANATSSGNSGNSNSQGGGSSSSVTVNVGYFTNPDPQQVAVEQGLFQKYTHAKINWVPVQSGGTALTEMASGALDFVCQVGNPAIATAISKGLNFKVIWVNENSAEALVAKSGIQSVAGLKGKTVGVAFGSTSQFTLMGALSLNHIPASSVKILDMQPSDQVAAFKRGNIQAAYVWDPFLQEMVNAGGHILVKSADLASKGYPVYDAVVVNGDFAKKYPSVVQGFVKAEQAGTLFYEQHPKQANALIAKFDNISVSEATSESSTFTFPTAQQQLKTWLNTNGLVEQGLAAAGKWLASSGSISSVPSQSQLSSAVDESYAQKVSN